MTVQLCSVIRIAFRNTSHTSLRRRMVYHSTEKCVYVARTIINNIKIVQPLFKFKVPKTKRRKNKSSALFFH